MVSCHQQYMRIEFTCFTEVHLDEVKDDPEGDLDLDGPHAHRTEGHEHGVPWRDKFSTHPWQRFVCARVRRHWKRLPVWNMKTMWLWVWMWWNDYECGCDEMIWISDVITW